MTVAALYVDPAGVYANLPGVEVWDEARDARTYAGPWPVVAHPPCARWCQLASVNEARWGAKVGDDGGCFAAALEAVERWGGVLEHPAYSIAWERFVLPRPGRRGWTRDFMRPGYSIEVAQVAYGHAARKRTWLYYVGDAPPALHEAEPRATAMIGANVHSGPTHGLPRIDKAAASATPPAFRDVLLDMARSAAKVPAWSEPRGPTTEELRARVLAPRTTGTAYLAARYSRRRELVAHADELHGYGVTVTSRWLLGNHQAENDQLQRGAEAERFAAEDIADLRAADVLVAFTETPRSSTSRGGRHVEFGYALALALPILVVGPREHVFCCLVDQVETWPDALPWLRAHLALDERRAEQQGSAT